MKRLGLEVEEELTVEDSTPASDNADNCEGGVCAMPDVDADPATNTESITEEAVTQQQDIVAEEAVTEAVTQEDIDKIA